MSIKRFLSGFRFPTFVGGTSKVNAAAAAAVVKSAGIPGVAGDLVAKEFPWWKRADLTTNLVVGTPTPLASTTGEAPFKNDTNYDLKIEELRWEITGLDQANNFDYINIKMWGDGENQDFVEEWLPVSALMTDADRFTASTANAVVIDLPADYYLKSSYVFQMELISTFASGKTLMISLHGRDPENMDPMVLSKVFTSGGAGVIVSDSFDDDRDMTLKDMIVQYVTIGGESIYSSTGNSTAFMAQRVKFLPPEGPRWSEDHLYLGQISNQPMAYLGPLPAQYHPIVIHRPVRPYILRPGQALHVEYMAPSALPGSGNSTVLMTARGTQGAINDR